MKAISTIEQCGIVSVIRGIPKDIITPVAEALLKGNVSCLELSLTTEDALDSLALLNESFPGRLCVGAGTVLTLDEARACIERGAQYLLSPVFDEHIISLCHKNNIPYIPGCLTPNEVYLAHMRGAQMIKIFSAAAMGPAYIKDLHGPFPNIKLMAMGGITSENIAAYFKNGATAVGVGGCLANSALANQRQFDKITENAIRLRKAIDANENTVVL